MWEHAIIVQNKNGEVVVGWFFSFLCSSPFRKSTKKPFERSLDVKGQVNRSAEKPVGVSPNGTSNVIITSTEASSSAIVLKIVFQRSKERRSVCSERVQCSCVKVGPRATNPSPLCCIFSSLLESNFNYNLLH